MPVPINTLIYAGATAIELYSNFIKNSQTMTLEEANEAWRTVQIQVKAEHVEWDAMIDEINAEGGN